MKRVLVCFLAFLLIALGAAAEGAGPDADAFRTVGNLVEFGRFEQDDDLNNGDEPLGWLVLDYDAENDRALLISRYGLKCIQYNYLLYSTDTWDTCSIRGWLNGEFFDTAFDAAEQGAVLLTDVDNSRSQGLSGWDTDGGSDTQDRVFLLSYAEANRYLGVEHYMVSGSIHNVKARLAPTPSCIYSGLVVDKYKTEEGRSSGWWWLRSPGRSQGDTAVVSYHGALISHESYRGMGMIRPAVWVDLTAGYFAR